MLRRFIVAGIVGVMVAGPAAAQALLPIGPKATSREQVQKEQREESAARNAMEDVPDRRPTKDPWGNVRSTSQPSGSSKKSH